MSDNSAKPSVGTKTHEFVLAETALKTAKSQPDVTSKSDVSLRLTEKSNQGVLQADVESEGGAEKSNQGTLEEDEESEAEAEKSLEEDTESEAEVEEKIKCTNLKLENEVKKSVRKWVKYNLRRPEGFVKLPASSEEHLQKLLGQGRISELLILNRCSPYFRDLSVHYIAHLGRSRPTFKARAYLEVLDTLRNWKFGHCSPKHYGLHMSSRRFLTLTRCLYSTADLGLEELRWENKQIKFQQTRWKSLGCLATTGEVLVEREPARPDFVPKRESPKKGGSSIKRKKST